MPAKGKIPFSKEELFHQMRLNDEGRYGMSQFKKVIEETGVTITEDHFINNYNKNGWIRFIAEIIDNYTVNIYPEITWIKRKGPKVIFENNNPNTKTPVITLTEKGTYLFMAIITDGEFKIKKRITITKTE